MGALSNRDNFNAAVSYLVEFIKNGIDCVMPAIVLDYDRAEHKATIQPLIKFKYEISDGNYEYKDRPILKSVSVFHLRIGGFDIDFPLKNGDTGWLVASDRDGYIAKQRNSETIARDNKGTQEPTTDMVHAFGSGFFLPDSWCKTSIDDNDANALIISALNENGNATMKITVTPQKVVRITGEDNDGSCSINLNDLNGKDISFHEQERITGYNDGIFTKKKSIVLSSDDYEEETFSIKEFVDARINELSN